MAKTKESIALAAGIAFTTNPGIFELWNTTSNIPESLNKSPIVLEANKFTPIISESGELNFVPIFPEQDDDIEPLLPEEPPTLVDLHDQTRTEVGPGIYRFPSEGGDLYRVFGVTGETYKLDTFGEFSDVWFVDVTINDQTFPVMLGRDSDVLSMASLTMSGTKAMVGGSEVHMAQMVPFVVTYLEANPGSTFVIDLAANYYDLFSRFVQTSDCNQACLDRAKLMYQTSIEEFYAQMSSADPIVDQTEIISLESIIPPGINRLGGYEPSYEALPPEARTNVSDSDQPRTSRRGSGDNEPLDNEPGETIELPSRVYYEGIGYRAPVEGVTSTGNTEPGRFSHHITGRFNNAEKITMPMVNPFTREEVEVSMIRYVVDVQLDDQRQIQIEINSFDYGGNLVYSLSRDGAVETIPLTWDQFSTVAQEGQGVVLLLRNLLSNDAWLNTFEESFGSCTVICEQALAFNDERLRQTDTLQNLVDQNFEGIEDGDTVRLTELLGGIITSHSISQ